MSTPDLESALIKAAEEGDEDTVRTMIENGVVNLNAGDVRVRARAPSSFNSPRQMT